MSDVRLSIGGRRYTISCADGQEDHVRALGQQVDDKLTQMGANLSGNEAKNLLFAAILLAEDVHQARATPAPADHGGLGSRLERLAVALENAADALESGLEPDGAAS